MKPYEPDAARVRALYRLAMRPGRCRVLELCFGAPPALDESTNGDADIVRCELRGARRTTPIVGCTVVADYRKPLPFVAGAFDLVVLHGTIDRLADADAALQGRRALAAFAGAIAQTLVPGGVIAGCVGNRTIDRRSTGAARLSIASCRALLERAGFEPIAMFNVLPRLESPLRLVSTDAALSRIAFRRELDGMRASLGAASYAARRAIVELGLSRFLERSLMFQAVRR
jgi:SAM-dependent methyltransferase